MDRLKELEKYFSEVYEWKRSLAGLLVPQKDGVPCIMATPDDMDEDRVAWSLSKRFEVELCVYRESVTSNIDRRTEQKRPGGTYLFVNRGGDEPDTCHLGKSYDDATESGMLFLNPKEYFYVTGFHMWKHGRWVDSKGRTRLSSLWSDGCLVCGFFDSSLGGLYLALGSRGHRDSDDGPRELFLG